MRFNKPCMLSSQFGSSFPKIVSNGESGVKEIPVLLQEKKKKILVRSKFSSEASLKKTITWHNLTEILAEIDKLREHLGYL